MFQLQIREDEIGRKLDEAHQSGELKTARGYGQPLQPDIGWEQTPEEFRMGFKILKDAGFSPPEVEMFRERATLRAALAQSTDLTVQHEIRSELSEIEQKLSVRLEALRATGSI